MPLAVIGQEFGPPESYRLQEYDPGAPKEGELRVAIKVAGISYVDVLTAMGQYQFKPPLPFIPGSEYAGIVEAVGEGVTGFAVGDRVFGSSMGNVFSQASNFLARNVSKVPDKMPLEAAAIFPVNYRMVHDDIVFRTAPGSKLSAALAGAVVAFEVDDYGLLDHTGWSVLAVGQAEVVTDPAFVRAVEASGLQPFAEGVRTAIVRIEPTFLSGRRLVHGPVD